MFSVQNAIGINPSWQARRALTSEVEYVSFHAHRHFVLPAHDAQPAPCFITQMLKTPQKPSLLDRVRYSARKAHASYSSSGTGNRRPVITPEDRAARNNAVSSPEPAVTRAQSKNDPVPATPTVDDGVDKASSRLPPPAPSPHDGSGGPPASVEPDGEPEKLNLFIRFLRACREIFLSSWINLLLVFVPVGIAVQAAGVNKTVVFAINAIAIIPLAGMLSHATESVASELGDTIGALMNITFGNAVELIIL